MTDFNPDWRAHPVPDLPSLEGVTAAQFQEEILPTARPVILKGAIRDWPSVTAGQTSDDALARYLLAQNRAGRANVMIAPPHIGGRYFYSDDFSGFNFERREAPMAALIEKLLELRSESDPMGIYAGATSSDEHFPAFAAENPMPLVADDVRPLLWLGNRSRVAPHFDASDNIACCVTGERTFLVFPPDQISNLYVGPLDQTMAGQPASLVDPRHIDVDRFPKFEQALSTAQKAHLEPGDAIFIPSLWWHYVEADSAFNVLINYWWDDTGYASRVMDVLALALLVIRDLPETQRAAWKAHFDHYIFSSDPADSVAHIPPHLLGPLGEKSAQRDQQVKRYLGSVLPSLLR